MLEGGYCDLKGNQNFRLTIPGMQIQLIIPNLKIAERSCPRPWGLCEEETASPHKQRTSLQRVLQGSCWFKYRQTPLLNVQTPESIAKI